MVIGDVSNPFSFIFPDDWLNVEQMPSTLIYHQYTQIHLIHQ